MQTLYTALLAFLGLTLVILVHELGHYLAGRIFNLAMPTVAVGFGPKIIGRQVGETEFVWRAIPVFGHVHFLGMNPLDPLLERLKAEEEIALKWGHGETDNDGSRTELLDATTAALLDPRRHYDNRSGWVQLAVILAGPIASIGLAFILWTGLGVAEYRAPTIFVYRGTIQLVISGSKLDKLGVKYQDLVVVESHHAGYPRWKPSVDDSPEAFIMSVNSPTPIPIDPSISLLSQGAVETMTYMGPRCQNSLSVLRKSPILIRAGAFVVKCASPLNDEPMRFHDPFGVGYLMANAGSWRQALFSVGIVTLGMGFINLLPILPLDGGRAVFALLKASGRPASKNVIFWLSVVGFYLLMGTLIYSIVKSVVGYLI